MKEWTLFHILGFLPFLVLGLIINMFQLVLYLLLFKISKDVFRRINYYLMFGIYGYFLFIAEWWSGSRIRIFCDQEMLRRMEAKDAEENAILDITPQQSKAAEIKTRIFSQKLDVAKEQTPAFLKLDIDEKGESVEADDQPRKILIKELDLD